jgi:hypothetical protein
MRRRRKPSGRTRIVSRLESQPPSRVRNNLIRRIQSIRARTDRDRSRCRNSAIGDIQQIRARAVCGDGAARAHVEHAAGALPTVYVAA